MDNLAEVRLWDQQVGALAYDEITGLSTFEYAPSWQELNVEIAPLHMPLTATKYRFAGLNVETFRGLPAIFADALPDDFGNAVIDAWLARQGRGSNSFTPVERLLYTGSRGIGALCFAPAIKRGVDDGGDLNLDSLVTMAQAVLDQRGSLARTLNKDDNVAMQSILQVGTSAGGARAKAIVAINRDRTKICSGQVDVSEDFEHYLLKFDGVEELRQDRETFGDPQGYGRMEYAYYLMAKDAGLNMSDSELLIENQRAHFMTKRFDRVGNRKRHYLSLCAMDHADYKKPGAYSYEQLFSVARQLELHRDEAIEIFRRMVFNVVARNHDDHTKNLGFLLDDMRSSWRLAPAFDVAYSYKKDSPWVNSHQMSINGKRDDINLDDLMRVSELIGNFSRQAPKVIQQVVEVISEWQGYAKQAGVFDQLQIEVQKNLRLGKQYAWY